MKRCPSCNRSYTDASLNFCLEDGTPLVNDPPTGDPNTRPYPSTRDTSEPPPTEIYRPDPPVMSATPVPTPQPPPQQQWTPMPAAQPKKSNAVWWVLGGVAALGVIGIGLIVMIVALASMSAANANNSNLPRTENRNVNLSTNTNSSTNVNKSSPTGYLSDDFSQQKWGTGESKFGRIWYEGDEYHMTSKDKTFIVMYAPSDD
jgi:hypothetical protein